MSKLIAFLLIILPLPLLAQTSLANIKKGSHLTLIYKITAKAAIRYYKDDYVPVQELFLQKPFMETKINYEGVKAALPIGFYVFVSAEDNQLVASMYNKTNLLATVVNNKHRLQLDISTAAGEKIIDAKVFINEKAAVYNKHSRTFWMQQKNLKDADVFVYSATDTLITAIEMLEYYHKTVREQRRFNFIKSFLYKMINWVPSKIGSSNKKKPAIYKPDFSSYVLLNKPMYKPLDTVKFKAYVLDKKWKQYNKPVDIYLDYVSKGRQKHTFLKTLNPLSAGSYSDIVVLGDSISPQRNFAISFFTKKRKIILKKSFQIDDYLLDEIAIQTFTADKEVYYKGDSMLFTATAKDANGLNVMDVSARLVITNKQIDTFFAERLFVPDTLYNQEVKMSTIENTKFAVSTSILPECNGEFAAKVIFKNSNNELQYKSLDFSYQFEARELDTKNKNDSLIVTYLENGKEKPAKGIMYMNESAGEPVNFPLTLRINPLATDYYFKAIVGKDTLQKSHSIFSNYEISFVRISNEDTLGFTLHNQYAVPVYYTVFNGNKIVATAQQSDAVITWKKKVNNKRQFYKVRWQYYWGGREMKEEKGIGLLHKLLQIKTSHAEKIFPGQEDSIKIKVVDYKNRPIEKVNLTAMSYNNQFKDIIVREPPYLVKYKSKNEIERPGFEIESSDEVLLIDRFLLGKNKAWVPRLGLDTMEYYKLLFPKVPYYHAVRYTPNSVVPQFSVNVVDEAVPQEIYLLYVNNELAYYNGVTDKMKYSFQAPTSTVKIGIRLLNRFIEIDSIYLQPNYKHEFSFDVNNLPPKSKLKVVDNWWSVAEMKTIENSMWLMPRNTNYQQPWLWQDSRVVKLNPYQHNIVGPFLSGYTMTFYDKNKFDIDFRFEPGYEYNVSPKILRLEKKIIFPKKDIKNYLPIKKPAVLLLGDTLLMPPVIDYSVKETPVDLVTKSDNYIHRQRNIGPGMGKLFIQHHDSVKVAYVILENMDNTEVPPNVYPGSMKRILNINPGKYNILLVNNKYETHVEKSLMIAADTSLYIKVFNLQLQKSNQLVNRLMSLADSAKTAAAVPDSRPNKLESPSQKSFLPVANMLIVNGATIEGNITDNKGQLGIPFATVSFTDYRNATVADASGYFNFKNIRPGTYNFSVYATGYDKVQMTITIGNGKQYEFNVRMNVSDGALEEVVVTALGITRQRKDLGYSTVIIKGDELTPVNLANGLQGRVSGLNIVSENNAVIENSQLNLRGIRSLIGNSNPIFIVDGIIYKSFENLDPSIIADITVMKGQEAVLLYGPSASQGAVIITTRRRTERKQFRDYAFWEPELFTDKKGEAFIKVNYPDNITAWRTFIVGMDAKRRIGKTSFLTQAYKPMLAQLQLPQFMIEADKSYFVTKSLNYTSDIYSVKTRFSVNDQSSVEKKFDLAANDATLHKEMVEASTSADTVTASFLLESSTGFKDMEEKKIPVFKKGIEQADGVFYVLKNDTSVSYTPQYNKGIVNLYVQNNTLDLLLQEMDHLKKYPYYCVEQMTSKFRGLAMERQVRNLLEQKFKGQREMESLLKKIQKSQHFDGGFPWWEGGNSNLHITNYITRVLLSFKEMPLVETNIKDAVLYITNELPFLHKQDLLSALITLSEAKHEMDYGSWMMKLNFDSLSQHQQWQWVKLMKQQRKQYQKQLQYLISKKTTTITGGIHWGETGFLWYSNDIATTVMAMELLQHEPNTEELTSGIIQYFLEMKGRGYWRNTVESASILNAILPAMLKENKKITQPATIQITGDTSFTVSSFPFETIFKNPVQNIDVTKRGGGMLYFTAYQRWHNPLPKANSSLFEIDTKFEQTGKEIQEIKSGEKVKMITTINVLTDADYVMICVPIPAGCIFSDKDKMDWGQHKEYYKDRALMYFEKLPKGKHRFEIALEARYNGTYNINPAKAELMYYPTFSGNNEMKKIVIANP